MTNVEKFFKRFIVASVCVIVVGALATVISMSIGAINTNTQNGNSLTKTQAQSTRMIKSKKGNGQMNKANKMISKE